MAVRAGSPPAQPATRLRGFSSGAWLTPRRAILAVVGLIVAYLALTPLVFLVWRMFTDADGFFTFANIRHAYSDPLAGEMLRNSFVYAIGSSALSMVMGTGLAYLHARTDIAFKGVLFAAAIVPLVVPNLLYTIAWILLAAPNSGVLNLFTDSVIGTKPFDVFTMAGMIWVEGTTLVPLVFLLMLAAFRSMDPSYEEAARTAGANERTIVFRITFPLVKHAFLAAALLMGVRGLESFETPALIGAPSGIWVFTSRIWTEMSRFPSDIGAASAYASVLLVIAMVGVLFHNRLARRGGEKAVQTIGGKAFRVAPRALSPRARLVANGFVLLFFAVVVVLPILALIYSSLLRVPVVPSRHALTLMSLDNYRTVVHSDLVLHSALNSLFLAIVTATAVMLLMAIASWIVVRTKLRGRGVLDSLSFLPITFPGIVVGLALLIVYLRVPLPIYGTLLILFIAYLTKYLPYGMRYATTSMAQVHDELEEAAYVSGAGWWQTFRRVLLPLVAPGFIAGWIYVAMLSVRELSSSLLIYSPGNEVLSIAMFRLYNDSQLNELAALGILLMTGMTVVVLIAYRIGSRVGIRQTDV